MWVEQPFETFLKSRLSSLPGGRGEEIYGDYVSARKYIIENVAEHIGSAEPDLTDHGPRHLADVMDRVHKLIKSDLNYCTPQELYILAVAILFHDVGNLHGREEHEKKVAGIYASVRGDSPRFRNERNTVLAIAGAHRGTAPDGSRNTLGALGKFNFDAEPIRATELAALLRLGDELAEGPHRTSAYLSAIGRYSPKSEVFHAYAEAVEYVIETDTPGRVAITVNIDIKKSDEKLFAVPHVGLAAFLDHCYIRIKKLDQERRYCKHFYPPLQRLTSTTAWFAFYYLNLRLDLGLRPIVLDDLVVPGDPAKEIPEIDPNYAIESLVSKLQTHCDRGSSR